MSALYRLAHLCGIQVSYLDAAKKSVRAEPESLVLILKEMGVHLGQRENAEMALNSYQDRQWKQSIEPVHVQWQGESLCIPMHFKQKYSDSNLTYRWHFENGSTQEGKIQLSPLPVLKKRMINQKCYVLKQISISNQPVLGYHHLDIKIDGQTWNTWVISAPKQTYQDEFGDKVWGLFAPLYSLHSKKSWGAGNFSDLETLSLWMQDIGGRMISTLPLYPAFLDGPFEVSPYSPASRLFWNEFYLDVSKSHEIKSCSKIKSLLTSKKYRNLLAQFRKSKEVDYRREMAGKKLALRELSRHFFLKKPLRFKEFERWNSQNAYLDSYASFRAVCDSYKTSWKNWPDRLKNGNIRAGDYRRTDKEYHLYVQWLAQEQIQSLYRTLNRKGIRFYLDFPLGVHCDGFDVWKEPNSFATHATGGAPPDLVFTSGQNWNFSPLHPEKIRRQKYRYWIHCIQHLFRCCDVVRLDHVMGLHRLYWIPKGSSPDRGVYVKYHAQELYAILCLESYKNQCMIVGENLGTVPNYVNQSMDRHRLKQMYVIEYELEGQPGKPLRQPTGNELASLNTHDMAPFSAYWRGLDIADRAKQGLLTPQLARREQKTRNLLRKKLMQSLKMKKLLKNHPQEKNVFEASLSFLSQSRAKFHLINLEDLWRETEPQNRPGTGLDYPNWTRKMKYSLEDFCRNSSCLRTLRKIPLTNHSNKREP